MEGLLLFLCVAALWYAAGIAICWLVMVPVVFLYIDDVEGPHRLALAISWGTVAAIFWPAIAYSAFTLVGKQLAWKPTKKS